MNTILLHMCKQYFYAVSAGNTQLVISTAHRSAEISGFEVFPGNQRPVEAGWDLYLDLFFLDSSRPESIPSIGFSNIHRQSANSGLSMRNPHEFFRGLRGING